MSFISNLVHQGTVSTGTGNITLSTLNGRQSFYSAFGIGGSDMFFYFITHETEAEWEVGTGHLSNAATLVRDTVIASSNANALVNFSSGDKNVVNDVEASRQFILPATAATGDIIYYNGTGWTRLTRGTNGQFLSSGASSIHWADLAAVAVTGSYNDLSDKPSISGTNTGDQVISDATLTTSDITTNNVSTSKHGFVPKGTNVGHFLRDDGTWAAPSGGGGSGDMVLASTQTVTGAKTFNAGKMVLAGSTSGTTTLNAAAAAGTTTIVLPDRNGTLADNTDLALKAPLSAPVFTTSITTPAIILGATTLTATGAELNYVSGVTSAIQTQLNGKQGALTNSAGLAAAISDETGTGVAVFNTSPTLVTPVLGAATATSINKVAVTAPATGATLTIADGATLTVSASATVLSGTHSGTNTGDQVNISGNAATVTTNANLSGPVTSSGNTTSMTSSFGITIDGGASVPGTGSKGFVTIPFSGTLTNYYLAADASGSAVIDIKRSGSSIVGGGNKPTLSSAQTGNAALSGWTSVAITAGDIIEFNLNSITTIKRVNLVLKITRTS